MGAALAATRQNAPPVRTASDWREAEPVSDGACDSEESAEGEEEEQELVGNEDGEEEVASCLDAAEDGTEEADEVDTPPEQRAKRLRQRRVGLPAQTYAAKRAR